MDTDFTAAKAAALTGLSRIHAEWLLTRDPHTGQFLAAHAGPDGQADDVIRADTVETLGVRLHALQRPGAAR